MYFKIIVYVRSRQFHIIGTIGYNHKIYFRMDDVARVLQYDMMDDWQSIHASCKFGDIRPDIDIVMYNEWAIEQSALLDRLQVMNKDGFELLKIFKEGNFAFYAEPGIIPSTPRSASNFPSVLRHLLLFNSPGKTSPVPLSTLNGSMRPPMMPTPNGSIPPPMMPTANGSMPPPMMPTARFSTPTMPTARFSTPIMPTARFSTPTMPTVRVSTPTMPTVRVSTPTMPTVRVTTPNARMPTPNMPTGTNLPKTTSFRISSPVSNVQSPPAPNVSPIPSPTRSVSPPIIHIPSPTPSVSPPILHIPSPSVSPPPDDVPSSKDSVALKVLPLRKSITKGLKMIISTKAASSPY